MLKLPTSRVFCLFYSKYWAEDFFSLLLFAIVTKPLLISLTLCYKVRSNEEGEDISLISADNSLESVFLKSAPYYLTAKIIAISFS